MSYNLETGDGILEIPDGTIIEYKDLEIVGQDKEYWNRPIQQNFVKIAEKLSTLESFGSNTQSKPSVDILDCGGASSSDDTVMDLGSASSVN
jgi:hypothetical protein